MATGALCTVCLEQGPECEEAEVAPRCRHGSKSDNPCWRKATTTVHDSFLCCEEHALVAEWSEETDAWGCALDTVEEWGRGPVSQEDHYGHLEREALKMRDEIRREYARACIKVCAAKLIANQGPPEEGEPRLTLEQSEKLARLTIRADSFTYARAILGHTPEKALDSHDRAVIVDALAAEAETVDEEVSRYRREISLQDE